MVRDMAKSVCLIAHFGYGALTGGHTGHVGGVERQTSLMARWFIQKGYKVSMLTWNEGQSEDCEVNGIRVISICRQKAGIPGIRFFHPRWSGLVRALSLANADVYYQNNAESATGQVALWCRMHGKRFVYSAANDPECDVRMPNIRSYRVRLLFKYGITHADKIIVQTGIQQEMLRRGHGLNSEVLPMPCLGPGSQDTIPGLEERGSKRVLWAARIVPVKRIEWLLEIARAAPDLSFDVVGPDDGSDYASDLLKIARSLANVHLRGRVPRSEMSDYFRNAAVLCSTSSHEGFPNTYLEAWSNGMPTVSSFDPDNLIVREGLGGVGSDPLELLSAIRRLITDPAAWQRASSNARAYFLESHAVEKTMPRFERAIFGERLLDSDRGPS